MMQVVSLASEPVHLLSETLNGLPAGVMAGGWLIVIGPSLTLPSVSVPLAELPAAALRSGAGLMPTLSAPKDAVPARGTDSGEDPGLNEICKVAVRSGDFL